MPSPTPDPISDKQDLLRAFDYSMSFFKMWRKENRLRENHFERISAYYDKERQRLETGQQPAEPMDLAAPNICWSCKIPGTPMGDNCVDCGAPMNTPEVQRLHYLLFLCHEIQKHEQAGRLSYQTMHDLLRDGNERIAAMRRQLDGKRIPLVEPAAEPPTAAAPMTPTPILEQAADERPEPQRERPRRNADEDKPPPPPVPRRHFMEILLDPRSIQWLLASGGVLLVLGLIIWLYTQKIFENVYVLAVLMAVANLALLAGGWALVSATRFKMAGRALTLLACLLLPLNLWFYNDKVLPDLHKNDMVGERNYLTTAYAHSIPGWIHKEEMVGQPTYHLWDHLWVGALVCCVLYAVSARLLKDRVFVYVFVGGVALTGMLMLIDRSILNDKEIITPASAFLVVLGLLCIHAERVFSDVDSPFSRKRFGLAFFWAGHFVLGSGLLMLLGAQITGWLLQTVPEPRPAEVTGWISDVTYDLHVQYIAILLTVLGVYGYLYSDFVVRRVGVYLYVAVFALLWAEVQFIMIFKPVHAVELVILTLSLTSLLANLAIATGQKTNALLGRTGLPLGVFLAGVPVVCGLFLHLRATVALQPGVELYQLDWTYVAAMAVTAVTCRVAAFLFRRTVPVLSVVYLFATAAATMAGAGGLLLVLFPGIAWEWQAPVLMVIPILYIIAARLYRGHTPETPLVWVAHAATVVMLVSSLGTAFQGAVYVRGEALNLSLAGFFAEAALFYLLAGIFRKRVFNVYLCTAMACAAIWQLLIYQMVADEYYTLVFAVVGLMSLMAYRFAPLEHYQSRLPEAAFQCGHTLSLLAYGAAALITFSRLATFSADYDWTPLWVTLFVLAGISLVALFLVREQTWRQVYVATTVALTGLAILVVVWTSAMPPWRKVEIVSMMIGVGLLVIAHVGWYREQERHSDLVSMVMVVGCLLLAIPLLCAVVYCRYNLIDKPDIFHVLNEIGMLAAGIVLLATGVMCRLKSTTITGALLSIVWLLTLVLLVRVPERLQMMSLYMIGGGGAVFAVALLLSFYRESLLKLPERIKRREGMFKVLSWR